MSCSKSWTYLALIGLVLTPCSGVRANPVVVGIGAEADDANSRLVTVFTDIGLTEKTWLSGSFARTDTEREVFDLTTYSADVAIDHHFNPLGVRLGVGYWGDDDLLESNDVSASFYYRGETGSASLELERRDFDLTVNRILFDPLTVGFRADGVGLSASYALTDRVRLFGSVMDYEYSRDLRIQPNVDTLRFFGLSRLSIVNSLVDQRASVGLDFSIGSRSLDVRYARWRTEVDRGTIDSIGFGFLTPGGSDADLELRLTYDDSENFGGATVFSVFLYLYDE